MPSEQPQAPGKHQAERRTPPPLDFRQVLAPTLRSPERRDSSKRQMEKLEIRHDRKIKMKAVNQMQRHGPETAMKKASSNKRRQEPLERKERMTEQTAGDKRRSATVRPQPHNGATPSSRQSNDRSLAAPASARRHSFLRQEQPQSMRAH